MNELADAEVAVLLVPCGCGHTLNDHGGSSNCWLCEEDENECTFGNFMALLAERVAGIVEARVAARVAAVEAQP